MKTKKKLLVALLSATCLTAGAFALTACKTESADTRDQAIVAVYNQYVAYAEANSQTVLTYEEWLESITGAQGPQGPQGVQGPQGEKGDRGDKGTGIESITLSDDGNYFIIKYTDSEDPVRIPIPQPDGHIHTYGDAVVIVRPTAETDGLAYRTCSEDGDIDIVIIKPYRVTVKGTDGAPVQGATVKINGATAVSDENGLAVVTDFGVNGDYRITVTSDVGGFFDIVTTGDEYDFEINLAKTVSGTDYSVAKGQSETFGITIPWEYDRDWGEWYVGEQIINLKSGDEPVTYRVRLNADYAYDMHPDSVLIGSNNTEFEVTLDSNSTYSFTLTADFDLPDIFTANHADIVYTITVECLEEAPVRGTIYLPYKLTEEGDISQASELEEVYFSFYAPGSENKHYQITFEDGVSVYYGASIAAVNTPVANGDTVDVSKYYSYGYFKVSAVNGSADFSVTRVYEPGEIQNPIELTFNETATAEIDTMNTEKWYKYTAADSDGELVLAGSDGAHFSVYTDTNSDAIVTGRTKKTKFTATPGTTYYIKVESSMMAPTDFLIRAYDEAIDLGYSLTSPIIVDSSAEFEIVETFDGSMYYCFTAKSGGELTVSNSNLTFVHCFNNAEYSYGYNNGTTYVYSGTISGNSSATCVNHSMLPGDSVWIKANAYSAGTLTITFTESAKVDYAITLTDGTNAYGEGITVQLKDGDTVVAEAQTDTDGKATFNVYPYAYSVAIVHDEYGLSEKVLTPYDKENGGELTVVLSQKVYYKVNVMLPDGETAAEGLTVTIGGVNATYSDGSYVSDSKLAYGVYDVTIDFSDSLAADYYLEEAVQTTDSSAEVTVTLGAKLKYNVKVVLPDGKTAVEGVTVTINGTAAVYEGEGVYALEEKLLPGEYLAVVKLTDALNIDYDVDSKKTTKTSESLTITLVQRVDCTVYVVDSDGNPVANVGVRSTEGTRGNTDAEGKVVLKIREDRVDSSASSYAAVCLKQPNDTDDTLNFYDDTLYVYEGKVYIGFTDRTATFTLNKLVTYTVKLTLESELSVANATVTVDGTPMYTDASGEITISKVKGKTVEIVYINGEGTRLEGEVVTGDETNYTVVLKENVNALIGTFAIGTSYDTAFTATVTVAGTYKLKTGAMFFYKVNDGANQYFMAAGGKVTLEVGDTIAIWSASGGNVTISLA